MKEATGEFSMTVITILAVVVIAGIISFLGPSIKKYIEGTWNSMVQDCAEGYHWDSGAGYCVKNS